MNRVTRFRKKTTTGTVNGQPRREVLRRAMRRCEVLLLAVAVLLTVGGLQANTASAAPGDFVNKTTSNTGAGLGSNTLRGVYVIGSTVYAATTGGLSISTDGGATFTNKTTSNGLGSNTVKGVYAIDGTPDTVYAATTNGLAISTDGGTSFTNYTTANLLGSNTVYGVYVSGSTIYAATQGGLSISTDGGTSFTNYTTANGLGSSWVQGVYASGSTVYAATTGGLAISTDGGTSFTNYTTADGLGNNGVQGAYVGGSNVYVATWGGVSIYAPPAPSSDPTQWITHRQAVPLSATGSCTDVKDTDYAYGTGLTGGWTRAWEPWVNTTLDANGNRIGGWACTRTLINKGGQNWMLG